jgi:hypothetical protein
MSKERLKQFLAEVQACWPAVLGTMAEVRKRCIRPRCAACAEGRHHPAVLFTFMDQGRRRCLYVPQGFVATLRQALKNGRRLEQRLRQMGADLIRDFRRGRDQGKP